MSISTGGHLMGAKRRRNNSINNYNNVVEITQFQKKTETSKYSSKK